MVQHQCGLLVLDPFDLEVTECCVEVDQPLRPNGEPFTVEFTLRNDEQVGVGGTYHIDLVDTETGDTISAAILDGHFELEAGAQAEYELTGTSDDLGINIDEYVGDRDKVVFGTRIETANEHELEDEIHGA